MTEKGTPVMLKRIMKVRDHDAIIVDLFLCKTVAVIFSVEGKGKSYQVHSSHPINPHETFPQARAILQTQLFEEYTINDQNEAADQDISLKFALNLTTLLDCLQLFGSSSESTSATMTYLV
jgi:hypothetical protein